MKYSSLKFKTMTVLPYSGHSITLYYEGSVLLYVSVITSATCLGWGESDSVARLTR